MIMNDKPYLPELIIMSTWDINGKYDNNVCGHLYEVIEYFWILKDHFNTTFIFPENISLNKCLEKYDFNDIEKMIITNASRPRPKNGIINTKQGLGLVLCVDGNLGNFNGIIRGIPIQFSCGKTGLYPDKLFVGSLGQDTMPWYLIHDYRISDPINDYDNNILLSNKIFPKIIFDYNKKILLTRFKQDVKPAYEILHRTKHEIFLMYLTGNCRRLTSEQLNNAIKDIYVWQKILIITDYEIDLKEINFPKSNIQVININHNPVDIFQLEWTTYLYTPISRQWDCSNRLIPETKYLNRNHRVINLPYEDSALLQRLKDTNETVNFMRKFCYSTKYFKQDILNLCYDDPIIDILSEIINTEYEVRGFGLICNPRSIRTELYFKGKPDFDYLKDMYGYKF